VKTTRARLITLRHAPFAELRAWITEVEAFWGGPLDSFNAYAERARRRRRRR
jgi:hypothetical protein